MHCQDSCHIGCSVICGCNSASIFIVDGCGSWREGKESSHLHRVRGGGGSGSGSFDTNSSNEYNIYIPCVDVDGLLCGCM